MRSKEVENAIKVIKKDLDLAKKELDIETDCTEPYRPRIAYLYQQKETYDTLLSYIEELEKENKYLRDENNIYKNETVSKNKIRDKIKELEEKLKYIGGCDNNCKKCFNSERENSFEYCFAYHQIKVLKSIIGE